MLHGWDNGFIVYFKIIIMLKNNKTHTQKLFSFITCIYLKVVRINFQTHTFLKTKKIPTTK